MIKAIFFDFGQTLVDSADGFRTAEKEAQQLIFADIFRSGGPVDTVAWESFMARYRQLRKQFQGASDFSRLSVWRAVYQTFERSPDESRLLSWEEAYWQRVKQKTRPFPETEATLEQLARTFRLGLISNTQGQKRTGTHRIALFPRLETLFESVIVAGEDGLPPKPDQRAFQAGLQQLGVAPAEAVYVGDDWRIDVCGARDAGMHPIWLKHRLVRRNWPEGTTPVTEINSLEEVPHELPD